MSAKPSALKLLAAGEFVCAVRYPEEFGWLDTAEGRSQAGAWVQDIGYRLARVGDEGAFFLAHHLITQEDKARVRDQMRTLRDRIWPAVAFLETVRQAMHRGAQMQPGDTIFHSELMENVRTSAMLEQRLADMRDVHGARANETAVDRLGRILAHLVQDGYLIEVNRDHGAYQITGKITYLYDLLAFMAENMPAMKDAEQQSTEPTQQMLDAQAGSASASTEIQP